MSRSDDQQSLAAWLIVSPCPDGEQDMTSLSPSAAAGLLMGLMAIAGTTPDTARRAQVDGARGSANRDHHDQSHRIRTATAPGDAQSRPPRAADELWCP